MPNQDSVFSCFEGNMTEGLLDRYFRLLAGRLPEAEYGVLADPDTGTDITSAASEPALVTEPLRGCLC